MTSTHSVYPHKTVAQHFFLDLSFFLSFQRDTEQLEDFPLGLRDHASVDLLMF